MVVRWINSVDVRKVYERATHTSSWVLGVCLCLLGVCAALAKELPVQFRSSQQ